MWAPRALISAEVVPFRPHKGIYLIVEESADRSAPDEYIQRVHMEVLPELVSVPGVAGAWSYATTPSIRRPMFTEGNYRMTVCYLDEDPASVGRRLADVVSRTAESAPTRLLLAAPFESMMVWAWDRFDPTD